MHYTLPTSYLASIVMTFHISREEREAFHTAVGRRRTTEANYFPALEQNLSTVEAARSGTSPAAEPRGAEGSASRPFPSAPGNGRGASRGKRSPHLSPTPGQRGRVADTSSAPDSPPGDGLVPSQPTRAAPGFSRPGASGACRQRCSAEP